jgi:hypothetical protein
MLAPRMIVLSTSKKAAAVGSSARGSSVRAAAAEAAPARRRSAVRVDLRDIGSA